MSLPAQTRSSGEAQPGGAGRQAGVVAAAPGESGSGSLAVLRNRPFLLLWLSQAATQIGGNMVLYGLTIMVSAAYASATAVSALLLSFLVPAVAFSAMAGVFVDRVDKRALLILTNLLRGAAFLAIFLVGDNLALLYLLVVFQATVTAFFAPAEASMIPFLVPRPQLVAANGLFTLTMNAAFAVGFALFGPFLVALASPEALILVVACLYLLAVGFCWVLPSSPPVGNGGVSAGQAVADAERAVSTMIDQFVEGIAYIRSHRSVGWSLSYLGIAGGLVGVLGVLGPGFARTALHLDPKDFVVVVLPLGMGIVAGILALGAYGRLFPRRRLIEVGMVTLGVLLAILSVAGPVTRFLQGRASGRGLGDLAQMLSLLSLVIGLAFAIGCAYAVVAIASQTQLQEDLPEEVRGRVFGVLNMLVSVASLLPIIVVGPIGDLVGTSTVILAAALLVGLWGLASMFRRGPLRPAELVARAGGVPSAAPVDPLTAATSPTDLATVEARAQRAQVVALRSARKLAARASAAAGGRGRGRAGGRPRQATATSDRAAGSGSRPGRDESEVSS
jgi:MFS family permease